MLLQEISVEERALPVRWAAFCGFNSSRLKSRRNTAFLVICSSVFSVAQITVGP